MGTADGDPETGYVPRHTCGMNKPKKKLRAKTATSCPALVVLHHQPSFLNNLSQFFTTFLTPIMPSISELQLQVTGSMEAPTFVILSC